MVICRNPWASVAAAGSLRKLSYCKLQESVGIRGLSWLFWDASALIIGGIRGHPFYCAQLVAHARCIPADGNATMHAKHFGAICSQLTD